MLNRKLAKEGVIFPLFLTFVDESLTQLLSIMDNLRRAELLRLPMR